MKSLKSSLEQASSKDLSPNSRSSMNLCDSHCGWSCVIKCDSAASISDIWWSRRKWRAAVKHGDVPQAATSFPPWNDVSACLKWHKDLKAKVHEWAERVGCQQEVKMSSLADACSITLRRFPFNSRVDAINVSDVTGGLLELWRRAVAAVTWDRWSLDGFISGPDELGGRFFPQFNERSGRWGPHLDTIQTELRILFKS